MLAIVESGVLSLQRFFQAVRVLRAPLLISLLSFFALSSPTQVLELYLILARGRPDSWPQIAAAVLSLLALAIFIAYAGRALARSSGEHADAPAATRNPILWHMPVLLGVLPPLGATLGLRRALDSTLTEAAQSTVEIMRALKSEEQVTAALLKVMPAGEKVPTLEEIKFKQINDRLEITFAPPIRALPDSADALAASINVGMLLSVALAGFVAVYFLRWRPHGFLSPTRWVFHPAVTWAISALFLALTALFAAQNWNAGSTDGFDFTRIPRAIGGLALLNVSLVGVVFATSLLTHWADRSRIPILSLLFVSALAISALNLNDNHHVRLVERETGGSDAQSRLPLLRGAFESWLKARPADYVKAFAGKSYPVYVVAAQGGGMYAANLSGLTLARLYDLCPAIRHHLFAVSGVSGGSVGAGYLAALLAEDGPWHTSNHCGIEPSHGGTGPLEAKMAALLQADFLAPVAASLLFPDLLQRFIPFPIMAFDRARAFEAGLERTWLSVTGSRVNRLAEPFGNHWRPDGAAPMLFLNTTVAGTGYPVVVAPVKFRHAGRSVVFDLTTLHESAGLDETRDVPLSTAMSLSARFPLVMPAGLVATKAQSVHLVDGGYFENSGVETARFVVERLALGYCPGDTMHFSHCKSSAKDRPMLAFRTIVLTEFDAVGRAIEGSGPRRSSAGLNELLSPLRASLNTRVARGDLAVSRQKGLRPGYPSGPTIIPAITIHLSHKLYELPLGWQLSKQVQEIIAAQIGDPMQCVRTENDDLTDTILMLGKIVRGLQLVAADAGRAPVGPAAASSGPDDPDAVPAIFVMFGKLHANHCALFDALAADGVAPALSPVPPVLQ